LSVASFPWAKHAIYLVKHIVGCSLRYISSNITLWEITGGGAHALARKKALLFEKHFCCSAPNFENDPLFEITIFASLPDAIPTPAGAKVFCFFFQKRSAFLFLAHNVSTFRLFPAACVPAIYGWLHKDMENELSKHQPVQRQGSAILPRDDGCGAGSGAGESGGGV
jgi:hypothetical protein